MGLLDALPAKELLPFFEHPFSAGMLAKILAISLLLLSFGIS